MKQSKKYISDAELAAALRCACTEGGRCQVEDCPYWKTEPVTDEMREELGIKNDEDWGYCDVEAMDWEASQRLMHRAPDCLNRLRDAAYADAVSHGLWEYSCGPLGAYIQAARLILSEAQELYEAAFRLDTVLAMYPDDPEHEAITRAFDHYCEELADVMIMSLSSCGEMHIDADMAVGYKMDKNAKRGWKHEREAGHV